MPVTPGSKDDVNRIVGVAKVMPVTSDDLTDAKFGTKVYEANILLLFPNGKLYLTDGTTSLKNLSPIVDQALTPTEKAALQAAFSTGSYVRAANGVVAHDSTGQIDDASLKLVETVDINGTDTNVIKQAYLQQYIGTDGKVKLSALPNSVRAGVTYVADITARNAITADSEAARGLVFVLDASGDATVTAGSALYALIDNPSNEQGAPAKIWEKIGEHESLDIDVAALTPNYTNVESSGAVMYDHVVVMTPPTLTALAALDDAGTLGGTVVTP